MMHDAMRIDRLYLPFSFIIADICFIENTIEAGIKIMEDDNLPVRIKASWALANITDALVAHM